MNSENIKLPHLLIVLAVILLVIPPLLSLSSFSSYFDFSSTGEIGDTIGGITAPFINGLAAILVFVAFREQVKANTLLQDQQFIPYIEKILDTLESSKEHHDHVKILAESLERSIIKGAQLKTFSEHFKRGKYTISTLLMTFTQIQKLNTDNVHLALRFEFLYDIIIKIS